MVSTTCNSCNREFDTLRGLKIHQSRCKVFIPKPREAVNDLLLVTNASENDSHEETISLLNSQRIEVLTCRDLTPNLPEIEIKPTHVEPNDIVWRNLTYSSFSRKITDIYRSFSS